MFHTHLFGKHPRPYLVNNAAQQMIKSNDTFAVAETSNNLKE